MLMDYREKGGTAVKGGRIVTMVLLTGLAALVCSPVLLLISGSLMDSNELRLYLGPVLAENRTAFASWSILPQSPSLRPAVELLLDSPGFFHVFWNSTAITAGILLGQLLVGAPAAWGFARYRFPLGGELFTLYLILMLMPFQVTMLSSYLALDRMGLNNTLWAVILPGAFSTFPVFIMYRFFRSIPEAVIESAKLDARNAFQIFWHIGVPLGSGGIVSAMVLGFLECWNLIEQPMAFLNNKSLWPLSLYLPSIGLGNAGPAFAGAVLTLVPAFLVFLSGRDYLAQGIVASALKE